MMKYYGQKVIWYVATLIVAVFLNFLLPRLMPGNPVDMLVNQALTGSTDPGVREQVVQQYTEQFGLDKSLPEQFLTYVGNLLQGDLGMSISQYPRTVNEIIGSAIIWTLALQIPAIIVGWILGNGLGALAAYLRGGVDKVVLPVFMFISNFPAFGLGMVFLWLFASQLHWFPVGGGYAADMVPNFSWDFVLSVLDHSSLSGGVGSGEGSTPGSSEEGSSEGVGEGVGEASGLVLGEAEGDAEGEALGLGEASALCSSWQMPGTREL